MQLKINNKEMDYSTENAKAKKKRSGKSGKGKKSKKP